MCKQSIPKEDAETQVLEQEVFLGDAMFAKLIKARTGKTRPDTTLCVAQLKTGARPQTHFQLLKLQLF